MTIREPTDDELKRAAVNALRQRVDELRPPDQSRATGQSEFMREVNDWAEANGVPPITPQFVSQVYRIKRIGLPYAHYLRRFFGMKPDAFVERFGRRRDTMPAQPASAVRHGKPK